MLTIRFVLVGMLCLLPQFALLANDKGDVSKDGLATKQVKYADIKAVKNNPSLTINFFRDGKEIGSWPFSESDGGRWRWENAPDITGRITFYYGDILIGKGLMIKSMKQGEWFEYDENNGRLIGEYLYVDDNRNGPYKEYSESGALSEEGVFISGNESVYEKGPYTTFYPTGEVQSKCEGAEELGEGSYSEKGCVNYNKKGGLFQTKADGVEREYSESGNLVKENIIDAGLNGTERIFYDSGKLKSVSKSHPVGQERDESTIEYYESGKIRREYVRITTATYQNNSVWGAMEWSKSLQTEDDKQYF